MIVHKIGVRISTLQKSVKNEFLFFFNYNRFNSRNNSNYRKRNITQNFKSIHIFTPTFFLHHGFTPLNNRVNIRLTETAWSQNCQKPELPEEPNFCRNALLWVVSLLKSSWLATSRCSSDLRLHKHFSGQYITVYLKAFI